ncbi:MAG: GNAT family N-acetyltransferase [Candidatus Komeilibacteria bacterium]|nr:GNAT family N-acetyltransferase [Candidatus Komeilibacteria bacterium]
MAYNLRDNKIISDRLYLRLLTLADASAEYAGWLKDPEVNKFLETRDSSIEDLQNFIQKQINDQNSLFYGIFDKSNDKHIGNLKLEPIDWPNKKAVFGILLGDKNYWGKGIGTEATQLIVDYAFGDMGLEQIQLGVIDSNHRAIRVYEKVGFKVTEIKKQSVHHDDAVYDEVIMRVLKNN